MSFIPLDNLSIQGAVNYPVPVSAVPVSTCKLPPEGMRAVPMQFDFTLHAVFLLSLSFVQQNANFISQIASVFVDASQSTFDISVYFPDMGYLVTCPAGISKLMPVFVQSGKNPQMYVICNNPDAQGVNRPASAKANVTLLNQFVPEFEAQLGRDIALNFGGDTGYIPKLQATMQDNRSYNAAAGGNSLIDPLGGTSRFYVTELEVGIVGKTTDASTRAAYLTVTQTGGGIIALGWVILTPTLQAVQIPVRLTDMNYISGQGLGMDIAWFEADKVTPLANVDAPYYANYGWGQSRNQLPF